MTYIINISTSGFLSPRRSKIDYNRKETSIVNVQQGFEYASSGFIDCRFTDQNSESYDDYDNDILMS